MQEILNLEPQNIWKNFYELNQVPRPSKKKEKVIQFMMDFGKKLNLETIQDKVGNVIIKKPASTGMENRKTIVLQSHLDMVCQKNNDVDFDFDTQAIQMYVDTDGFLKAKGTTSCAYDGIGVGSTMAVREMTDDRNTTVEALVTMSEE